MKTPDIIVSIATGYTHIDQYKQFISTLRKTGATCPIFLGISDGPEYQTVKKYLLENAVNYFIVPPIHPGNKVVRGYRFEQYQYWLKDMPFRYALMMDFRDAYFQRDPFENAHTIMRDCGLYLMSEFIYLTIRNHPNGVNYDWIERPFGHEVAESIKNEVILNSGAIMGNKQSIMKFLDLMATTTKSQDFNYEDQGTLNYLYHTGLLKDCGQIKIERAGVSLVNNCGFLDLDVLQQTRKLTLEEEKQIEFLPKNSHGRLLPYQNHKQYVLDDDGNISYAVHQYDRFYPEVQTLLTELQNYIHPDLVYVNSQTRPYKSEKYIVSSMTGLKPNAIEILIDIIKKVDVVKKPLLVINSNFKRGFVFTYGILYNELLCDNSTRLFFEESDNDNKCKLFCEKWGYEVLNVNEDEIFRAC